MQKVDYYPSYLDWRRQKRWGRIQHTEKCGWDGGDCNYFTENEWNALSLRFWLLSTGSRNYVYVCTMSEDQRTGPRYYYYIKHTLIITNPCHVTIIRPHRHVSPFASSQNKRRGGGISFSLLPPSPPSFRPPLVAGSSSQNNGEQLLLTLLPFVL